MAKVIIIAEAGVNHNGDFQTAKMLVDVAVQAGADYVKFQTFKAAKLVTKTAAKAGYQMANVNDGNDSQFEMLRKLEMPDQWHYELQEYANNAGIGFLSTGFDEQSIDLLEKIQIPLFKIPSGEITNKPYLEHVAKKGKPIIISTGMANLEEIRDAVDVIISHGVSKNALTVLHCNTEYPTPFGDVNLLAMNNIKSKLGIEVGYSDHTLGIEVAIAAVALGATVIEKHFTLDRNMPGPDHRASLEPDELTNMVTAIRNIEMAISGNGKKEPSESEIKNRMAARKSIYVNKPLNKGDVISDEDITMKRPGDGISPMMINLVVGKKINRVLPEGHKLSWEDIES